MTATLKPQRHARRAEPAASPSAAVAGPPGEEGRRWLNIAVAVLGLLFLSPLMLLIGFLIKLTSPGPIFYTQIRVGQDRRRPREADQNARRQIDVGGLPFRIYKFRTMRVDAERETGVVWASQNDPRVTFIGRVLRKTRLDELPQLFNVIRGDMNIVGPRPERPAIFATLRKEIDSYELRQRAKPGITGLAQIHLTYDTDIDHVRQKVTYDLRYVEDNGLIQDLHIMLRTIPVVLFRKTGW